MLSLGFAVPGRPVITGGVLFADKSDGVMDIPDFDFGGAFRSFAVQGPGDIRRSFEKEGGSTEETEGIIVVMMRSKG